MIRIFPASFAVIAVAIALPVARAALADTKPVLPLRSARLYETGVGYFQRTGTLTPRANATLPVPAAHLDDALQTLVILSGGAGQGGAEVHGVEFASSVSSAMARSLVGLPEADASSPIGFRDLLVSLRGSDVEVRTAAGVTRGRLLDVVSPGPGEVEPRLERAAAPPPAPGAAPEATAASAPLPLILVVVTDRSEILRVKATDVTSIRPTDAAVATRLSSAVDALSGQGHAGARPLALSTVGSGPVTLGYIAETPVWRTTYRLVEDASGTFGVLQGWALIHNDTDEEWRDVRVELVNGRPDSFLFPLAAPRYARRELVHPEDDLSTVPQLVGRTVDSMWDPTFESGEGYATGSIGLGGVGIGGGGAGAGSASGRSAGVALTTRTDGSVASTYLEVGNLAPTPAAAGVESGALFRYALKDVVHLGAHASLLVPFVQQRVDAELLAFFAAADEPARSGVRVVNATPQTLPAGPIAFFADGGFAGEASLTRQKPGDKRFVLYGADLDVELTTQSTDARDEPEHLVMKGEELEENFLRTTDYAYAIVNRSGAPRAVYLRLAVARNARVTGPDRIDFDDETTLPLAVFHVDAKSTKPSKMTTVEGLARKRNIRELDAAALATLAAVGTLPAAQRAIVAEAAARAREGEGATTMLGSLHADIDGVERDVARFRDDLTAARGADTRAFAARLERAEDRLGALRAEAATLVGVADAAQARVRAALDRLKS